jgi:hypothetical protein
LVLKEENLGGVRLGNENFDIHALAAAPRHGSQFLVYPQNIAGFNAVFSTKPGYNLVLGNGTPIVKNLGWPRMHHRAEIRKHRATLKTSGRRNRGIHDREVGIVIRRHHSASW